MAKLSALTDSAGAQRLSVETVPDIEWIVAAATKALRAERAEIERVSGFILQRMESVVSSERMMTIIPSLQTVVPPPVPVPDQRAFRSKVVVKKKRRMSASKKRERGGATLEKVAWF